MPITFYGGAGEIGGNKILLEDSGARIFLDFGLSFSVSGKYYDTFLQPRKYNGMRDFFEMGILPDLKGVYRNDFLEQCGMKSEKPELDAVFLTHAHMDHCAEIPLLKREIPVYCSRISSKILHALEDTGDGYETEYFDTQEHFTGLHYTKVPHYQRNMKTFESGDVIKVKGLEVIPVNVDHSVPGAHGFIIRGSKPIAYTGDFRMHGRSKITQDFIDAASRENIDTLIIEGTRIDGDKSTSEEEVSDKISSYIKETGGLVAANFPPRDLERIKTFYSAAKANGRNLVINMKMAYLLKMLSEEESLDVPDITKKGIQIYIPKRGIGKYDEKEYEKWQREFLGLKNAVKADEIRQDESVLYLDSYSFSELIDIKPKAHSTYIYSLCEPFSESMELDHERLMNWVNHFNLDYRQAHASGHAGKKDITELIRAIAPKRIIPVHTEHPELFREMFGKDFKVEIPKIGEKIKI